MIKFFLALLLGLSAQSAFATYSAIMCDSNGQHCYIAKANNGKFRIYLNRDEMPEQKISDLNNEAFRTGNSQYYTYTSTTNAEIAFEKSEGMPVVDGATDWKEIEKMNLSREDAQTIVNCSMATVGCGGSIVLSLVQPFALLGVMGACYAAIDQCTTAIVKIDDLKGRVLNGMRLIREEAMRNERYLQFIATPLPEIHLGELGNFADSLGSPEATIALTCYHLPPAEISGEGSKWMFEAVDYCSKQW